MRSARWQRRLNLWPLAAQVDTQLHSRDKGAVLKGMLLPFILVFFFCFWYHKTINLFNISAVVVRIFFTFSSSEAYIFLFSWKFLTSFWRGVGITQVCGFEVITQCVIKILIALGFVGQPSAEAVLVININPKASKQSANNAKNPIHRPSHPADQESSSQQQQGKKEQWSNKNCSA